MKVSQHKLDDDNINGIQEGPKLRNIHEEKEVPEEKPAGADVRLKIAVVVIAALIIIVGIKGAITNSSLSSKCAEQEKLLTASQAEALLYGITQDEDGDLIIPEINIEISNIPESNRDSIEQRNTEKLSAFTSLLLNWKGKSGYDNVRQKLMDEPWCFTEDSKLLSAFMPVMNKELNANMSLSSYTTFVLTDDGKNMSYFLICTVRNTIDGTSATGTVGIRITINEDGTLSDVVAQTLS